MKKLNNKGLSLVELIIAVGIFALVMVVIFRMMVVSTRTYTAGNNEVNAQNEAQSLMNQLDNIIAEASEITKAGSTYNITKGTSSSAVEVVISYIGDKLYYYEKDQLGESGTPTNDYLLSENVTDFRMDLSNIEAYRYVGVDLTVTKAATKFTASKNIFMRNIGSSSSSSGGSSSTTETEAEAETEEESTTANNPEESGSSGEGSGSSTTETTAAPIKTVQSIRVNPTSVTINKGDQITGALITVYYVYSDGSEAVCNSWTPDTLQPTSTGNVTITDNDKGLTAQLTVNVNGPQINGLKATWIGPTAVKSGTTLSDSYVKVEYTYSDGSTEPCNNWISKDPWNNETKKIEVAGNWTILSPDWKYNSNVNISIATITGLEITNNKEYLEGVDEVKASDFIVKYKYSDNTYEDAKLSDLTFTKIDEDTYQFHKNWAYQTNADIKLHKIKSFIAKIDKEKNAGEYLTKDDFYVAFVYNIAGVTYNHQLTDFYVGLPATPLQAGTPYKFVVSKDGWSETINYHIGKLQTVTVDGKTARDVGVSLVDAVSVTIVIKNADWGLQWNGPQIDFAWGDLTINIPIEKFGGADYLKVTHPEENNLISVTVNR